MQEKLILAVVAIIVIAFVWGTFNPKNDYSDYEPSYEFQRKDRP